MLEPRVLCMSCAAKCLSDFRAWASSDADILRHSQEMTGTHREDGVDSGDPGFFDVPCVVSIHL